MFKVIVSDGETKYGPDLTWIDTSSRHALDKVASVGVYVPPSLEAKINELAGRLPRDKVAFYNRALGSFESFGVNRNGDGFARSELAANHDTFVKNANYFKHHVNKDPALSRGKPVASALNEQTDMVDLIIVADRDKCEDQIQALESGGRVPTSMGAKVAFDVCTICGNEAKTRAHYCEHVKMGAFEPYGMTRVLPDGRVCGVMNPNPKFFDISDVIVGAAAESETLMKVAGHGHMVIPSAALAEMLGLDKMAEEDKESAHVKEIPGELSGYVTRDRALVNGVRMMAAGEKRIPGRVIDEVVKAAGFDGLIRASSALGIVLAPEEFARGAKIARFHNPTVKDIVASEAMPEAILAGAVDEIAVQKLAAFYDQRSVHAHALFNRCHQPVEKTASENQSVSFDDDGRGFRMYAAYRKSMMKRASASRDSRFMTEKYAGTNVIDVGESGDAYICHAFTDDHDTGIQNKVLDQIVKFANHPQNSGPVFGAVTNAVASELGVEALDVITLQSIRNRSRL